VCVTVCNVACLITCMSSVCFLSDTCIKSVELCQVTVRHFVTLTEDSAAPGSKSSRIVVRRLEEIFCIMEESMVSVLCLCVQKNKISSLNTLKTNYIYRKPTDWLLNCMQYSPSCEGNSSLANQQTLLIL